MRARLQNVWSLLRESLWALPLLIVVSCVGSAVVLIEMSASIDPETLRAWPRLFGAGSEGARGMLTTIASSMITVAGVTFSITMVVLSLTSSQYTSRVLRTFLEDRDNQAVLGVFVGIYAYCLVVLRTIRGGDQDAFVPSLAILGAVVLAFLGIGVLIHFIHHVSHGIRVSHIIANIADDTRRAIDRTYPPAGEGADEDADVRPPELTQAAWRAIDSPATGYVQLVDAKALLRAAEKHDAVVRIDAPPGTFVVEGMACASATTSGEAFDDVAADVRRALVIGPERSIDQDVGFGVRQIVDIALKALSSASNDPTTARMCLDHLSALLVRAASRGPQSSLRHAKGRLRAILPALPFESLLALALDEIRLAARDSPHVLMHIVDVLALVARATKCPERRHALRSQLEAIADSAHTPSDPGGPDRSGARFDALRRELQ